MNTAKTEKIQKLLRLAKGNANPNEAAAAMSLALKLAAGEALPPIDDDAAAPEFAWSTDIRMVAVWHRKVASAVCRAFGCWCIRTGKVARFAGLADVAERAAEAYRGLLKIAGPCTASFGHGLGDALIDRTRPDYGPGLIPVRECHPALAGFVGAVRTVKSRRATVSPREYHAGREAGQGAAFSSRRALCGGS
jgi:hypothetical protein